MITQTGYPSIDKPWMKFYSPKCKEIDIHSQVFTI